MHKYGQMMAARGCSAQYFDPGILWDMPDLAPFVDPFQESDGESNDYGDSEGTLNDNFPTKTGSAGDAHAESHAGSKQTGGTITHDTAIAIFSAAKNSKLKRHVLAKELAEEFRVTTKAILDILNVRTWAQTTRPYWTSADMEKHARRNLCPVCKELPSNLTNICHDS